MSRACRSSPRPITRRGRSRNRRSISPLGSGPYKVGKYRDQPLRRVRPGQGLVGGRSAGQPRQLQFRYRALRVLSRPRRRVRRLYRQELSVPRGVHRADLGDALRFSGRSRTAASSARPCRMNCRRAGRAGSSIPAATSSRTRACAKRSINAFDFEWTNKTVMYGAYARTVSPFQNSDMVANGPPSPEELKLLEPFRGQVPDEVFGEPFVPPVSDGSGQDRALLRKAQQLLQDAGLPIKDGKRLLPNGEVFKIEFLLDEPSFQPHHATFIKNLGAARHRGQHPADRRRAISRARRGFRFRHDDRALEHVGDAGRQPAAVLFVAGGRDQGLVQSGRRRQSRDRRAGREGHRRRNARGSDRRLPRARSRVPRRPLLGAAMVSHQRTRSPIGTMFAHPAKPAALCARHRRAGQLVV